jgi:hypothetical protein
MGFLLEYVTLQTVLMRHPNMEPTIRRFFADAGNNSVQGYYDDATGLGGYMFHVIEKAASSLDRDDEGRYFQLVTTCDVTWQASSSGAPVILRPRKDEEYRIGRQFSHNEWFTGRFRGRLDRVAAIKLEGDSLPERSSD